MAHEDTAIVDAPAPAWHDRAVLDIIAGLLKIHGFPEFFDAAAAALARLVGADGAALVVPDGADRLRYRLFHGLETLGQAPITKFSFPAQRGTVGQVLATGEYRFTADYAASEAAMPEFIAAGLFANLVLPLGGPGGPLGALAVAWLYRKPPPLTADALAYAEFFAALIGNALYREGLERQLEHRSLTDPLTGLPNRRMFMLRLREGQRRAIRNQSLMVLAVLDLDGFKAINDVYGHAMGDQRLCQAAEAMRRSIREVDMVARLGGDEFVIILEDICSVREVRAILRRIVAAVANNEGNRDSPQKLTASLGASVYPLDFVAPDTLLKHADQAMYRAKRDGGNQYALYDEHLGGSL